MMRHSNAPAADAPDTALDLTGARIISVTECACHEDSACAWPIMCCLTAMLKSGLGSAA